jgi:hypothetical protein
VSAEQHHTAAQGHHPGGHHAEGHDHHQEPAEETLAPDESPTPLWLPVLGAVLFFVAFIVIAAF